MSASCASSIPIRPAAWSTRSRSTRRCRAFCRAAGSGADPGEGVYKRILPDAHTDFVFAVTGEEFGIFACLALIAFFAFIVLRGLWLASRNEDPFCRFAAAGLVIMFGMQSWINMAVNMRAVPAKGMTLPFISYGGSSLLALGLGMGFLIALTRKRPHARAAASGRRRRLERSRAAS